LLVVKGFYLDDFVGVVGNIHNPVNQKVDMDDRLDNRPYYLSADNKVRCGLFLNLVGYCNYRLNVVAPGSGCPGDLTVPPPGDCCMYRQDEGTVGSASRVVSSHLDIDHRCIACHLVAAHCN
jgi:hypothetical protein